MMSLSSGAFLLAIAVPTVPQGDLDLAARSLPWRSMLQLLGEPRAIDGRGNNPQHPEWGRAGAPFRRIARTDYGDGFAQPAGGDRPSARYVSNFVVMQEGLIPNTLAASDFVWQWGQFLDHDIDLTELASPDEPFWIAVPVRDPWFNPQGLGGTFIPLSRSHWEADDVGIRQQVNEITAWIDGSMVYGSDPTTARELRELDGSGRMRTSPGALLPLDEAGFFLAGDVRANEQVGLTAMHTLFVREHNAWADAIRLRDELETGGPGHASGGGGGARMMHSNDVPRHGTPGVTRPLTGDEIYELARAMVVAEIQAISFREFLPVLLGQNALGAYPGYDPGRQPDIANEFTTACYRFGHSMLSPVLRRLDASGSTIAAGDLPLAQAFFNPNEVRAHGIEPLLRGLAGQRAQEVDAHIVDAVRNFLFGAPGSGGFDLASLNIQRGRDHGLASYVDLRRDIGLGAVSSFEQITSNADTSRRLAAAYGTVEAIDAWVGALAEDHVPGALVGPTNHAVLSEQFAALRAGDRFWYERMDPRLVDLVERQTLASIVRRNTTIGAELASDVFHHE